jgi:hypothetical protein
MNCFRKFRVRLEYFEEAEALPHRAAISNRMLWQQVIELCYPLIVTRTLNLQIPQPHVSPHKFFRLLSYTASYF